LTHFWPQLIAPPIILSQSQTFDDVAFQDQLRHQRDQQKQKQQQKPVVVPESSDSDSSSVIKPVLSPVLAISSSRKDFRVKMDKSFISTKINVSAGYL
jgi:hypothetical protein